MTKPLWSVQLRRFFSNERRNLVWFVRSLIDDAADRDAEDIVQDVAFRIFEKGNILEPIENLGAYIYQALRNRVIDSFRSKREDRSLNQPLDSEGDLCLADIVEDTAGDLRSQVERNDLFRRAINLIRELPEREQAIIIATEIEGFSFAELSERWKVPIGTLLSQKSRSLKKIREALQPLTIIKNETLTQRSNL